MSSDSMTRAWGAPVAGDGYLGLTPQAITDARLRAAVERVSAAANWYPELDAVVVGLVLDGEADQLRAWSRAALEQVGYETAEERDPAARQASAEAYADAVMDALDDLADLI
jgi:hypothetical protein